MSWKTSTKLGPFNGGWVDPTTVVGTFVVLTAEGEQGKFTRYVEAAELFKKLGKGAPWCVPGLRIECR